MYIYLTNGLKVYNKIHYFITLIIIKNKLVGNWQWIITLDLSISLKKPRHLPKNMCSGK